MIGGNIFSVIVNPFISTPLPSYFFVFSFGLFSLPQFSASNSNSLASPSITSGMNDFGLVIFSGSASDGLKFSICFLVKTIEANAVFSWREYGALKRWRADTRITSTESSVDLIVSSILKLSLLNLVSPPYELEASSLAVLILQVSQNWISLSETLFIFPLHVGHIICFRLDFMCSTSVLHLMSGQTYFPIIFFSVGFPHFGQRCFVTSSFFSFNFSLVVRLSIS